MCYLGMQLPKKCVIHCDIEGKRMKILLTMVLLVAIMSQSKGQDIVLKSTKALKTDQLINSMVDMDMDGFVEIVTTTGSIVDIYDGKTKTLKYTMTLDSVGQESLIIDDLNTGRLKNTNVLQDFNGNGVKDLVITGLSNGSGWYMKIVDVSTRTDIFTAQFQPDQDYFSVMDADGDLFYDIIIGRMDSIFVYGTKGKISSLGIGDEKEERTAKPGNTGKVVGPNTQITWHQAQSGNVSVMIFTMTGELVKTLGVQAENGVASIEWNGTNNRNQAVAEGAYLYTIKANGTTESGKMLLMR